MKKNLTNYCLLVSCAIFLWVSSLVAQPDLTLQNFQAEAFGEAGIVTTYTLDLQNLGTETAAGEYTIGAYISADSIWNETDSLAGIIPTGNTPVGTIFGVPGAITVPDLPTGDYYLILVLDIYDEIAESNEENNQAIITYSLENEVISENNNCEIALGAGEIICHQALADGNFEAYQLNDEQLTRLVFSPTGELLNSEEQAHFQMDSLIVRDGEVIKKLANDSVVWRREIPVEVLEIAPNISQVTELMNGDFVFASLEKYGNSYPFSRDSLILLKTDAGFQLLSDTIIYRNSGYAYQDNLKDIRPDENDNFTVVYNSTVLYQTIEYILNIVKFDKNFVPLDNFSEMGSGRFLQTPCGNYRINIQDRYSSSNGRVSGEKVLMYNFDPATFQRQNLWSYYQSEGIGGASVSINFNGRAGNGLSISYGNSGSEISLPPSLTLNFTGHSNIEINAIPFNYLIRTDHQIAVIFYNNENQLHVTSSNCLAIPQSNDLDLQIITEDTLFHQYSDINLQVRVQNHSATDVDNVMVELPLPAGLVHSRQSSTQGEYVPFTGKWTIGTLAANSTAVIDLKLFPLVNEPLDVFAQISSADLADVDSTPANGNCCAAIEDDEAVVRFIPHSNLQNVGANQRLFRADSFYETDAFRLSPTVTNEAFDLYFQSKQAAVNLTIFNVQGQPVFTKKMETVTGLNQKQINVNHLPSGLYFVQLTGTQTRQILRFIKQE